MDRILQASMYRISLFFFSAAAIFFFFHFSRSGLVSRKEEIDQGKITRETH